MSEKLFFIPNELKKKAGKTFIPALYWDSVRELYVPTFCSLSNLSVCFNSRLQEWLPFSEDFFLSQDCKENLPKINNGFKDLVKQVRIEMEGSGNTFLGIYKCHFDDGKFESLSDLKNQDLIFVDFRKGKGMFSD